MIDSTSYQNGLLTPSYCFLASGKVVAKFCAKYLHREVLHSEAYAAGDLGAAVHRAYFRYNSFFLFLACLPFHYFIANLEQMM